MSRAIFRAFSEDLQMLEILCGASSFDVRNLTDKQMVLSQTKMFFLTNSNVGWANQKGVYIT
jgi:hypothetical protein